MKPELVTERVNSVEDVNVHCIFVNFNLFSCLAYFFIINPRESFFFDRFNFAIY